MPVRWIPCCTYFFVVGMSFNPKLLQIETSVKQARVQFQGSLEILPGRIHLRERHQSHAPAAVGLGEFHLRNRHEPVRVRVRQRPQPDRVEEAEDGRGSADAERQG